MKRNVGRSGRRAAIAVARARAHPATPLVEAVAIVVLIGANLIVFGLGELHAREAAASAPIATPIVEAAVVRPAGPTREPTDGPTFELTPEPTAEPTLEATLRPTNVPTPTPVPGFSLHVPILTYHVIAPWSVASGYSLPGLDVEPAVFDQQLGTLYRNGWRTITVDTLSRYLADKRAPPRRTFVITIDDGHDDGYVYALPILRKYGFVATYYVVAGRVGGTDNLDWAQSAELQADGMEIGNHTLDHVNLTTLSSSRVAYEINAAEQLLSANLVVAPTTFAYPFGAYSTTVAQAVRAAALRMALTTQFGAFETWSLRFYVERIAVSSGLSAGGLLAEISPYA